MIIKLYDLYLQNRYKPWDMETTLETLKNATLKLKAKRITIIKMGLHMTFPC